MAQTKIVKPLDSKVSIYNNSGSILLRFTYRGKRYNISLGLPVNEKNLKIARLKCSQITNDIIFNSPKQKYIDTNNFSKRVWKPLINKLVKENKIRFYIPFYDERHCFGSQVCRQTTDLKTVSYLMGNSPETLQKYYLSVDTNFEVPEI